MEKEPCCERDLDADGNCDRHPPCRCLDRRKGTVRYADQSACPRHRLPPEEDEGERHLRTLRETRALVRVWEPAARLLGNVRAADLGPALDAGIAALAREDAAAQAEPLVVLSCPPCEDGDDPQRTHPAGAWVLDAVTHEHGNEARAPTEREARALLAARLRATAQKLERE